MSDVLIPSNGGGVSIKKPRDLGNAVLNFGQLITLKTLPCNPLPISWTETISARSSSTEQNIAKEKLKLYYKR